MTVSDWTAIHHPDMSRPLRHLPNQPSVNRRIWKWVNILQSYDFEIRHIPARRKPADTLNRRDCIRDKKSSQGFKLKDEDLVKIVHVNKDASNDEI